MLPKVTRTAAGITIENLSVNEYTLIRESLRACRNAMQILNMDNDNHVTERITLLLTDLPATDYNGIGMANPDLLCMCTDTFICEFHGGPEVNN